MGFLVRKIMKRPLFDEDVLKQDNLGEISSDIPTSEFKTKNSTLSTWHIDDLKSLDNAILAISLSSTEIRTMDFIVIKTEELDTKGLVYSQTNPGILLPIQSLESTHYDILNLTLNKLRVCTELYINILSESQNTRVIRYTTSALKQKIKQAITDGIVDENRAQGHIKETIMQLKEEINK